ncbi:hypothetical protein BUALT_Bualt07G0118700 [Buddleja alternifolia]|uniref:NAD-dependent epimerase/dehydratase domain-containing protein n=1 Tax=Buddleja alternifolia TaxID=168488 RepID=A0AAV6XKN2_9LAMI|nr:hypothetical protein BUALT_Bualt07G0118700 [Buddleja alternifolia]
MPSVSSNLVCVTGAGSFIASWLVKLLLEKGYTVRGTVRNPENVYFIFCMWFFVKFFCRADLNDYQSLRDAINGCVGVFHTACPVPVVDDPRTYDVFSFSVKTSVSCTRGVNPTAGIGDGILSWNRKSDPRDDVFSFSVKTSVSCTRGINPTAGIEDGILSWNRKSDP